MKRPMCILAVSWLAGLCFAGLETHFETNAVLIIYFLLLILGLFVLKKNPRLINPHIQSEWYPNFTLLLLCIPILFLAGNFRMEQELRQRIQEELPWKLLEQEGEVYVTVEGTVRKKKTEEKTIIELTDCVIIGYYGTENQSAGDCRIRIDGEGKEWLPESVIGNKIRVFGEFSVYRPAGNPGQFDAYKYYTGRGIYADVSALKITVLEGDADRIGKGMYRLKQHLRKSIASLYPNEKAGVLAAMLLGDKDMLPEEVENLYRQNGISHILAISGLHISMLCMGLFSILRKLTVPVRFSVLAAVCFLLFYVVFTGASTSSVRAAVMCFVIFGAKLFRRRYDLLSSLAFAVIVVTCIWPTQLSAAGFLLSFGAVLGVALAKETEYRIREFHGGKRPWWCVFLFGGMIQCITIPVSLWFFCELSPYGIFLNLVVIPLVSLIIGGGIISAVLGLWWPMAAKLPAGGTYLLLEFYEWLCHMTRKLPFSFVLLGRPSAWQVLVYYVLLAVLLWWFLSFVPKKILPASSVVRNEFALAAGLICTAGILFLPAGRNTEILFMDVSQGDGALITTADGTVILSDCGSSDVLNLCEYRLEPVLKHEGIVLVDMAVVSHLDGDHISGIKDLLHAMPVYDGEIAFIAGYSGSPGIKELVLPLVEEKSEAYEELEVLALQKNVTLRYIRGGEVLHREKDFLMECLSPYYAKESDNDTSLVFLLQTPRLLAWLMGDAGIDPEEEITERLAAINLSALQEGKTVLLKVGHHGSKTSSGESFISFVNPDFAVISCGYRNIYGHPHRDVTQRLASAGAEVFRTDLQGAVLVNDGGRRGVFVRTGGNLRKVFSEE